MEYITYSHRGNREINEDVVLVKELHPNILLAIVADGMGGYEMGKKAAQIVVECISNVLMDSQDRNNCDIERAIETANSKVKEFNEKLDIKSGTTIGGVIINKNTTQLFWVGDVRIDIFKRNKLIFRSEAHTLIEDLKKQLKVVSIEMIKKYRHIVTKSISGNKEKVECGYKEIKNRDYQHLVISSDGVHQCIDPSQILEKSYKVINEYLKEHANDNHSYIIVSK